MAPTRAQANAETGQWGRRGTAGAAIPVELGFENVTQRFGDVTALTEVSLRVKPGEVLCLLGASGCGKTTLLRLAAGVDRPTGGRITLDGIEVAGPKRFVEPENRGVGLVFQDYALFPHLSVMDNVRFGLKALDAGSARQVATSALARVGLADLGAAYPHMLSGGEQQRVALARAIAPRPGVLLMDEPFSNLDRRLRDEVRNETLALIREMGATAIVVTHDPEDAMRIADRIALMRKGRLVQAGTAQELYRRPVDLYAARFFCDFNEVSGTVQDGAVETPLGRFAAPGLPEGETATVCVRPTGIDIAPEGEGISGRLRATRFLGDDEVLEVIVAGLEKPLSLRRRSGASLAAGRDVAVTVRRDEVLVFAASGP